MLLHLLACADPEPTGPTSGDTGTLADTGAHTGAGEGGHTGDPTVPHTGTGTTPPPLGEPLDACAVTGGLVRDWSVALPGVAGDPGRIVWDRGTLLVFADSPGGSHTLHAFDLPAPPAPAGLSARWTASADTGFTALAPLPDRLAVADGRALRILDRATGAALATAEADAPITSLAADGSGVFGGTTGLPFRWHGALTHDPALGLAGADAVGRTPEGYWTAADVRVGRSDGSSVEVTEIPAFGDAVEVLPRPDGGVHVLGGPEVNGWFASIDPTGALRVSSQTFVGILQAAGSPASDHAWTSTGGGDLLTVRDEFFQAIYTPGMEGQSGLALDPDGRWLLLAHADGTLSRWSCAP